MPDDLSVYGSMFYPTMLDIFMIIITKYRKFIFFSNLPVFWVKL